MTEEEQKTHDEEQAKPKEESAKKEAEERQRAIGDAAAKRDEENAKAKEEADKQAKADAQAHRGKRAKEEARAKREGEIDKMIAAHQRLQIAARDAGRELAGILKKRYVAGEIDMAEVRMRLAYVMRAADTELHDAPIADMMHDSRLLRKELLT